MRVGELSPTFKTDRNDRRNGRPKESLMCLGLLQEAVHFVAVIGGEKARRV